MTIYICRYDLILLEIDLPTSGDNLDGLNTARSIRHYEKLRSNPPPKVNYSPPRFHFNSIQHDFNSFIHSIQFNST